MSDRELVTIRPCPKANPGYQMIENFQCPGCVSGTSPTSCTKLSCRVDDTGVTCDNHTPGTSMLGGPLFNLGLPKGFNHVGARFTRAYNDPTERFAKFSNIRLWPKAYPVKPVWNHYNVAVWALEQDGYLFVRTYSPRINFTFIDVVEGGTLALVPTAINIAPFLDDMD